MYDKHDFMLLVAQQPCGPTHAFYDQSWNPDDVVRVGCESGLRVGSQGSSTIASR